MHWFFKLLIKPLLEALRPLTIVEIGVEVGAVSGPLLRWASANGATLHAIDPDPTLSVERLEAEHGATLQFHRKQSLDVLSEIASVDLALIDGDHNWYTVTHELRALTARAHEDGREPPVMLLHDVGWPYGRRDLYYDPASIPAAHRHPHARGGVKPERSELGAGLNDHLQNATLEGTPANGVLSAVEDFVAQAQEKWHMWTLPGLAGMAILITEPLLENNPQLRALLDSLDTSAFLLAHCEAIEAARIDAELKRANIQRRLSATQLKQVLRSEDPRAKVALQQRVRELTERVADLEADLEGRAALLEQVAGLEKAVARLQDEAMAAAAYKDAERPPDGGNEGASAAQTPSPSQPDAGAEREAWQTLLDGYLPLLEEALPCAAERDPLSLACPLDLRGVLREAGGEQQDDAPRVDVVVCVHDALSSVRECLSSLLVKTERGFHLIVVNDGSDQVTSAFLRAFADRHPLVQLIHREDPPHGYTLAANAGLLASTGDYVVLLNSDTIVTPGWLTGILRHGERHPDVGILGPLSNAASHQSLPLVREGSAWATNPLPPWLTSDALARVLAHESDGAATPFPFLNGFCYAIKRSVIERVGLFDAERFAAGYCEENDYSLRARADGFQLAVVADAYVYHAKSRSYGSDGRAELAQRNYEAFLDKHGRARVQGLVAELEADASLTALRAAVAARIASPRAAAVSPEGEALSVAFLLPGLAHGGSGGSHSLYQETCALRSLGVPARILLPRWDAERAAGVYDDAAEIFQFFADEAELAELTADADVISATHHKSVALLSAIRARRSDFLAAYYVQDYEPFFTAPYIAAEAVASYTALPEMLLFSKSHWLCNVVGERHGLYVAKVQASLDRELFTPGQRGGAGAGGSRSGPLRVAAMVRPRTARRQPLGTIAVLEKLLDAHPGGVLVSTFGCYEDELRELLGSDTDTSQAILDRHLGLLSRSEVAELLGESDVFLDMSVYQAFGRTALEAMACGATAVVPQIGGVWEFVEHERNALAVDTLSPDGAVEALGRLVSDRELLEQLQAGALASAARYSAIGAALSEYVLFERAYRARFGETGDAQREPAAMLTGE